MFAALRQNLVTAWTRLRQGNLAKLFLFELVVITIGVLLAQAIAEWAQDRADRSRFEASLARYDGRAALNLGTAQGWIRSADCIRSRLDDIMLLAGRGEDVPSDWLDRPTFWGLAGAPIGDGEDLLLLETQGTRRHLAYFAVEAQRVSIDRGVETMVDQWALLAVLDPQRGPVGEGDRTNARLAAAHMLAALKRMEIAGQAMMIEADRLGLEPDWRESRLMENCDEFWLHGAYVPLEEESR